MRAARAPRAAPWLPACLLACLLAQCALGPRLLAQGALGSGVAVAASRDAWERPGCHQVGHTRKISIPDCIEFVITTNACRGYCESWSVPSAPETLRVNPHQPVTSVGQCCNIMDTEDVHVRVMCLDGARDLVFKSAKTCSCYHCKKD